MTISGSGYNANLNPPTPSIYETETSGQKSMQNDANIGRGNVVIVPQSKQDDLPFTRLFERNTWNYKSESNTPTLLPQGQVRGAGVIIKPNEERVLELYEELLKSLPEDVKELLLGPPTTYIEAFKKVMRALAEGERWLEGALENVLKEGALSRAKAIEEAPVKQLIHSQAVTKEVLLSLKGILEEGEASHPDVLEGKEKITSFLDHIDEVKRE